MSQDSNLTAGAIRIDVYPDDHVDPPISHGLVGIVVILWLGCLYGCIKGRIQALRTAAKEDASVDDNAPLEVGSQRISGVVEFAEGEKSAVDVYLHQHFPQEDDPEDRAGLTWRDSHRTSHVRPFYVRRGDGQRIRVEPDAKVLLVDELDFMISEGEHNRIYIARISEGDKVIVEGVLSRDRDSDLNDKTYRDLRGWIMRPQPERALHISAEPLGRRHRLRANAFRDAMRGVVVCGLFMHAAFSTYYARAFTSELTTAQIANKDTYSPGEGPDLPKNHLVYLNVTWPETVSFSRELDADDWSPIRSGDIVEFRHVSWWKWASNPGRQSSIHLGAWALGLFSSLIGSIFFAFALRHRRWYEEELLDLGPAEFLEPPSA